jgi:hypothetical protein
MGSLDATLIRQAMAEGVVVSNGTDASVAIRLRYRGPGTPTSATVDNTANSVVLVSSEGGVTKTDTYLLTSGNYTTVGALADKINSDGRFEAKVLDALRSAATEDKMVDGAITSSVDANGVAIWDVKVDTSAALYISSCLSSQRDFDSVARRVKLTGVNYLVDMATAAGDSAQLWLRRGNTEVKVMGLLSVDNTATTVAIPSGSYIGGARPGDEYIFLVKDAATLADADKNYVAVGGVIE